MNHATLAEGAATIAGLATVAAVLTIGAAARGGPRPRTVTSTPDDGARPDRRRRWVTVAAGSVALAATAFVADPVLAVGLAGLAALVVSRRGRVQRRRARAIVEATFPDAVELFVLCLHAGLSPVQAVDELAARAPPTVRPGFAAVVAQLHRGAALADALRALPAALGPCAREVAAAVAAADREGLALGPVLDRLAADARTTRRRQGEAAARQLPVRLSFPLVACTLPAFVLLALAPAVLGALSTLRGTAP